MKFFINKKAESIKLLFLITVVFVFCFNIQTSFAGVYHYKNFEVDIKINEDSTFDVTEKQTYYLNGSFGFFNRDVSYKDIDTITDIEVFDGENNKIPKSELEIKSEFGGKHIQWNFPRRFFLKEEKSWTVKYKVHGGISFLKDYDEIYWNAIPPDRTVSIENVKVIVNLPNDEKFRSDLIELYSEQVLPKSYYLKYDDKQAIFEGRDIRSNTNFTIAAGFSKGIVSKLAYGKDFLMIYYGYILSVIIFLSCLIIGSVYWYKTERSREGKRAIIPQYEPPQNLRPAMAEIIVKEKLTNKGLAATIIDLAVRGYVKIEEDPKKGFSKALHYLIKIIVVALLLIGTMIPIQVLFRDVSSPWHLKVIFLLVFIMFLIRLKREKQSGCVDYRVVKTEHIDHYENDPGLEDYEKKYLNALFGCKNYFSTKEIKKDPNQSRSLFKKIKKVKDKIYEETELDTRAFERGLTMEKKKKIIWAILIFATFFSFQIFFASIGINQFFISALIIVVSVIGLYAFIKYEARLSDQGIKLKEDWLGFEMYLKTAERYRMQNLKPEFFEKYLPYAMIFEVEKKWAKAFELMHMPQPSWYVGSVYMTESSLGSASSFSPLAFSNSFSSSFTSAFSSSGASGASGGGGGAGGGGGGGGGGAG